MEIKATLKKPYTEEQRLDFIVQQSHNLGYEIRETETALEAWGYTQEEKELKNKERIAKLYRTGADVERGIYQAKGMDFDDILTLVTQLQPEGLDIKALKIELKANNFYRGNPYVSAIGKLLGFTEKQLDLFFETNNYLYLTNCTLTIVPTPEEAVVTINGVGQRSITVPYETDVQFEVACEGYISLLFNTVVTKDETFEVALEPIEIPTEEPTEEPVEEPSEEPLIEGE